MLLRASSCVPRNRLIDYNGCQYHAQKRKHTNFETEAISTLQTAPKSAQYLTTPSSSTFAVPGHSLLELVLVVAEVCRVVCLSHHEHKFYVRFVDRQSVLKLAEYQRDPRSHAHSAVPPPTTRAQSPFSRTLSVWPASLRVSSLRPQRDSDHHALSLTTINIQRETSPIRPCQAQRQLHNGTGEQSTR